MKKVFITNKLCPGDTLMLTAAIRDLYNAHKDKFAINVCTTAQEIWENNPYLDKSVTPANADISFKANYDLVFQANMKPYHFIHGFRKDLERNLKVSIPQGKFSCDLHLSKLEKKWTPQIQEITKQDLKYWIIVSGVKKDYTCKGWEFQRYQEVVDYFKGQITFIQCGELGHAHPPLKNVIDLRGKTDTRQFIRLMYHASGVLSGVSFPMHLSTMETRLDRCLKARPGVIIAGSREPANWEQYPYHQYIHRNGMLPCCENGGCWRSRVIPLGDGDKQDNENKICLLPIKTKSKQVVPLCMHMISKEEVINAIDAYRESYERLGMSFTNKNFNLDKFLIENTDYNGMINKKNNCKWIKNIYNVK